MPNETKLKLIAFDWKDSITADALRPILQSFGLDIIEVETGTDEYAFVIGQLSQLTQERADEFYRAERLK